MIKQTETKTTDAQTTNMWQDILREAMTKKDLEESHMFIFGDKYVGKRSLIKIMNKELNLKGEFEGIMNYYIMFRAKENFNQ